LPCSISGSPGWTASSWRIGFARGAARRRGLIALTGYGQPDDRQRTTEAGDLHLTKPITIDAILHALNLDG
jgi:CheY-like chemotaxis protein